MFKDLSYLDRQNRRTVYFILFVIFLLFVLLFVINGARFSSYGDDALDTLASDYYDGYTTKGQPHAEDHYTTSEGKKAELFHFDPNTADSISFLRLGLSPYIIRNICRYRSKGGIFRCPEDFAQVWGLTMGQYRRLAPYIRISDDFRPASEFVSRPKYGYPLGSAHHEYPSNVTRQDSMTHPVKVRQGEYVPLNASDTTQLCRVPGIGKGFARRIYRYRQRLGGFISREQLLEIQDMPESALPYFRVDGDRIRKLRINHSTNEQLRSHPYIDYRQARDIQDYRRLRGDIRNASDLRAVHTFTDNDLKKLLPYIDFN